MSHSKKAVTRFAGFFNVNDRLCKAYLYKEIKQSENAIRELNHIIVNFPEDPLYISVRQMKTEIEGV